MADPMPATSIDPSFGAAVRLLCLGLDLEGPLLAPDAALEAVAERVRSTPLAAVAPIQATRAAYKRLGKDASRYRPASEALWRRIGRGEPPPRIAPLVDLNTLVSLTTGMAAGVYDRERLAPPVVLRVGAVGEIYPAIGGQPAFNLEALPVLADGNGPFGSPTRDGERARVTAASARVLFVLFDFGGAPETTVDMVQDLLAAYVPGSPITGWQVEHTR